MQDVLADLMKIWQSGGTAGVATVVRTFRSAPRPPGALLVVASDGTVSGSVSGGCVEGAVYELATETTRTGVAALQRYGISDDDAFAVGLSCGGIIDVFTEPVSQVTFPEFGEIADHIERHLPVAVATVIDHTDIDEVGRRLMISPVKVSGTLGSDRMDSAVVDDARGLLAAGRSEVLTYGPDGQRRGEGMSVVVEWPHRYLAAQVEAGGLDAGSVICVLTHDPKFDVPLLEVALRLPEVGYIGAMGSRRTHDGRVERLKAAGITDEQLDRLASPIGLDLGARTPEETAVSIAAEIIARRWGGAGRPLSQTDGRIHHE